MGKGSVLLIFPDADKPTSLLGTRARAYAPPLGLLYLAAELSYAGCDIKVVDFSAQKYSRKKLLPLVCNADVIGVSSLSYVRKNFQQIISDIRAFDKDIPIMIGGPDCTAEALLANITDWELKIPDGVDVMVIGEAEHTIAGVVRALMLRKREELSDYGCYELLSECAGVIFRIPKSGEIRWGKPYCEPQNLDNLPFPDRNFVNRNAYTLFGLTHAGVGASIITSRGCPYRCAFCTRNATSDSIYRERSAENVLEEIQQICDSGYKVLYIVDDNFMVNERRVHAIMDGIIARKIKMTILAQGRVYPCSAELYEKMKAAGVQLLSYGLESGNQDVLDFYNKRTTIEQAQRAVHLADKCGILTHGNFILGAPIETRRDIKRTIKFAFSLPLDAAFFGPLNYVHGSELWNIAYSRGLVNGYEREVRAEKKRGLGELSGKQLEKICRNAQYRFYLRPTLWARYLSKLNGDIPPFFAKLLLRGFLK